MSHLKKYFGIVLSAVSLIACKNHQKNQQPNVIILMTWFLDSAGDEFGAYYVYINKLIK